MNLQFTEGARSYTRLKAHTKKEAPDFYRSAAAAAKRPFIYLSAGMVWYCQ